MCVSAQQIAVLRPVTIVHNMYTAVPGLLSYEQGHPRSLVAAATGVIVALSPLARRAHAVVPLAALVLPALRPLA